MKNHLDRRLGQPGVKPKFKHEIDLYVELTGDTLDGRYGRPR